MAHLPSDTTAGDRDDHADVEEVRTDLACPACGYNLRGLHGTVVRCPECGAECDIARLVTQRWTRAWYRAPGFNTVLMPAVVSYLGLITLVAVGGCLSAGSRTIAVLVLLAVAAWGWQMARAWRVFDGPRGLGLALLAHVLVVGYLGGVVGFATWTFFSIGLVGWMRHSFAPWSGMPGAWIATVVSIMPGLIGLLLLIHACRRGERYIAAQCIRRYLMRIPPKD